MNKSAPADKTPQTPQGTVDAIWKRLLLIATCTGIFGALMGLLSSWMRPDTLLNDFLTPASVFVASVIAFGLIWRGYLRTGTFLFAAAVWLAQVANAYFSGEGVFNLALVFQIVPILLLGFFVSWRMGVLAALASIATVVWLALTIPPPSPLFNVLEATVAFSFLYLFSLAFSYLASLGPQLLTAEIISENVARLENETKYQQLSEILPVGVFRMNKYGECLYVNNRWSEITGFPFESAMGVGWHEAIHPDDREFLLAQARQRSLEEESFSERFRFQQPNGRVVWVIGQTAQEHDEQGRLVGFTGTITDVTKEELATQALAERDHMYSYLVENIADGVAVSDETTRILYVNDQYCTIMGYAREELVGYTVDERVSLDEVNRRLLDDQRRKRRAGQNSQYELTWRNGRGRIVTAIINAGPWHDAFGKFAGTITIFTDITERKKAELALQKSETLYRDLVETMYEAVAIQDKDGNYVYVNDQHCKLLGVPRKELLGRPPIDFITISAEEISALFKQKEIRILGQESRYELTFTRRDGLEKTVIVAARPLFEDGKHSGAIIVSNDITERVRTERALRQTQKLESLGVLAGGVAHDFNNLLVAMLGQSSLALRKLDKIDNGHIVRPHLQKTHTAANRAADLTKQLLAYSGQGHFQVRLLDINQTILENLHLFAVAVPPHVELDSDLQDNLPLVRADATQIQQVIMNLIINGAEACPTPTDENNQATGRVTVRTRIYYLTDAEQLTDTFTMQTLSPGTYICLKVIDNGCGMDEATIGRIFDPFFTTKPAGRGLGLAAVLGIVRGHQGSMRVTSELGQGTTFQILLPVVEDSTADDLYPATSELETSQLPHTVLIIDDEPTVREAATDILQHVGMNVLAAADGLAGLRLYKEHAEEIELVLLDLTMPGLDGEKTLAALREINPNLRIILSSGYNQIKMSDHLLKEAHTSFLPKPYSAIALITALDQSP